MSSKLKPLSEAEWKAFNVEIEELATRTAKLGNIIGPAYGAAWCDKALTLERKIFALKVAVEEEYHARKRTIMDHDRERQVSDHLPGQ